MSKETPGILGIDRIQSSAHSLNYYLPGSSLYLSQDALDLGEGFFYRIGIWRVGRQVRKLATRTLDELSDPHYLAGGEVVHNDYPPSRQVRQQYSL
jgi:hypothetical protein